MKQRVGSYEIVRVLARGGMAVVYLAYQPALDRDVALKRLDLQGSDPNVAQRFVREARLAAGLDHPNIVTLFDFFEDGGVPFIAMEYVGGGSLRPLVSELDLAQVFGVLEGVLAGLAHAEAAGIAHRDLKPENVLITRGGSVKIADFGIARAYDALTPSLTSTGSTIGTPTYMAPEQALDEPLGPYTDLYALGIIAYELLAGRPPFEPSRTPMAVLYCHVHRSPPPLAELAPDVPEAVCGWVEWLLAKKPEDRPASADDAAQALEEIAVAELGPYWRRSAAIAPPVDGGGDRTTEVSPPARRTAVAPEAPPRPSPRPRRRRLAVGAVAALVIATAALVGWAADSEPPAGPDRAVEPAASYDFDGDDRQELAIGLPTSGPSGAGIVLTHGGRGAAAASDAEVTARAARLAHLDGREGFGTSVASADFDRDGRADLAASAPGRDLVLVIHGTARGLRPDRVERIRPSEMRTLEGPGRYGSRLLAADLDRDGYGDLVVGAPDADRAIGSGAIQVLFGGPEHMQTDRPQTIPRPVEVWQSFGIKLRAGDVNGDGNVDLVEGAPDTVDGTPGHLSYCLGTRTGRMKPCVSVGDPATAGTSGLAVADVNGDDYGDIVQGDALAQAGKAAAGGQVRVWRGGRDGPKSEPITIVQGKNGVPGSDDAGDAFGAGVDGGDLDGDGYADVVIAAPEEGQGAGAVTVVRGGRTGIAQAGHAVFAMGDGVPGEPLPGRRLGWSISVLELSGDERLDVAMAIRGADRIRESVYVIQGGEGVFAPQETKVWPLLRGPVGEADIDAKRIRLGRVDGI